VFLSVIAVVSDVPFIGQGGSGGSLEPPAADRGQSPLP
jgi:hypothetical protein